MISIQITLMISPYSTHWSSFFYDNSITLLGSLEDTSSFPVHKTLTTPFHIFRPNLPEPRGLTLIPKNSEVSLEAPVFAFIFNNLVFYFSSFFEILVFPMYLMNRLPAMSRP